MMLVNVLSYIDRNTLALLAPTILRGTGLGNQQYGFIISAFSITYMLCNPLWGRIVDRLGARLSMKRVSALLDVGFGVTFFGPRRGWVPGSADRVGPGRGRQLS